MNLNTLVQRNNHFSGHEDNIGIIGKGGVVGISEGVSAGEHAVSNAINNTRKVFLNLYLFSK